MADGSITAAKVLLTDLSNLQPLFNWDDNDVSLFHYDGASLAFSTPAQTNSGASAGIISKTAALNTPGHMRAKESTIFEVKPGEQLWVDVDYRSHDGVSRSQVFLPQLVFYDANRAYLGGTESSLGISGALDATSAWATFEGGTTVSSAARFASLRFWIPGNFAPGVAVRVGRARVRRVDGHRVIPDNALDGVKLAAGTVPSAKLIGDGFLSSARLGWRVGGGGAVTQATSKTTSVTLNSSCGVITMNNAALAAGASVRFVLNSSHIDGNDLVLVNCCAGFDMSYRAEVLGTGAGYVAIRVTNISGGSLSQAVWVAFGVLQNEGS